MSWEQCILDATLDMGRYPPFTFCPIEGDIKGDYKIVTGMMFMSDMPPDGMELVGIVHLDGQEAVEAFCAKYATVLEELRERLKAKEESNES